MNSVATIPNRSTSVLVRMAERYGIDPERMMGALKATAFKGEVTNEQMLALLVVAEQYGLNPWLKEIYAFPSRGGITPVVGVDGWLRIVNNNPAFDGMTFIDGPPDEKQVPTWIECQIHRKDRAHPVTAREYMIEVRRDTDPWKSHPRRMLRHKALVQGARMAFGFSGIYDQDEGERIAEAIDVTPDRIDPRGDLTAVNYELRDKHVVEIGKLFEELGSDEAAIGPALKDYVKTHLAGFQELQITVWDKLVADGIATKSYLRKLCS